MPPVALLLVFSAAALHVGWNVIVKRAPEKQVMTWWALVVGTLVYLPLLAGGAPIPTGVWPYAIASALAETAYFMVLIRAYDRSNFSLVYPIARGAAPAFLASWSVLFLGERINGAGAVGLAVLLLGLVVAGSSSWSAHVVEPGEVAAALTVSLCISIYSAIDGVAVHLMAPAAYTVLVIGLSGLFITPVVFARYGYRPVLAMGRAHWLPILAVGVLMMLTYILVLQAYALARVSYVGALREVSVVLAALVGWLWLGEGFGALRTIGAALIFCGILVIALAG